MNDQRALEQSIFEINEVVAGTLRLGAFTSVAAQWLPFLIRDFQKKYPNVEFELLAGDYDEITEHIFSGKIDCGFLSAPTGAHHHHHADRSRSAGSDGQAAGCAG